MRHIKVIMANGSSFETNINGTNQGIKKYYSQGPLNIGVFPEEKMELVKEIIFMDEKTYQAHFNGRLKNAIGVTYPIKTTVKGTDEHTANINLYDTYEHISGLKLEEI